MDQLQNLKKSNSKNDKAILFLIFNRPDTTKQVFERIKQAKPPRLYVAADGPRSNKASDSALCEEARRIALSVDWPCEVLTLFRNDNLGCKQAVSSAIDWFFSHEESGIILEDDCLPHIDFFKFCNELLDIYSNDHRISVITGNNFQNGQKRGNYSYYFSKYNHCWGWATWRRSWKSYDGNLSFWPQWSNSQEWKQLNPNRYEQRYWSGIFDDVRANKIDSWAYPWTCSVWHHGGLTATPNVNLVTNIGFGSEATHTTGNDTRWAAINTESLGPLVHPLEILLDRNADLYVFDFKFGGQDLKFPRYLILLPYRIIRKIYRIMKASLF